MAETLIGKLHETENCCREVILLEPDQTTPTNYWLMELSDDLPLLHRPDGSLWRLDYRSGKSRHRAAEHNRSQQPLARALGIHKLCAAERSEWRILDGTAGAGADGWQLAAAGASVTLVEYHPILWTLLQAAIQAASETDSDPATRDIATRIVALNERVESVLDKPVKSDKIAANAVYLDPMYPSRRSRAAVKKPMQFIQGLVGRGPDPVEVLRHCLNTLGRSTLTRVVVKRPSEASPLITQSDWHGQLVAINAGAVRFDVYLLPS